MEMEMKSEKDSGKQSNSTAGRSLPLLSRQRVLARKQESSTHAYSRSRHQSTNGVKVIRRYGGESARGTDTIRYDG